MNDNELLIAIGADTSAFTKSLKRIKTDYNNLSKNLSNTKLEIGAGAAKSFAKQMDKIERAAKKTSDKIKKEMMEVGVDEETAVRYEKMYKNKILAAKKTAAEELKIRKELKAKLKSMGVNAGNTKDIEKLKKRYDYEARRQDILFRRKMANIRRAEAREKQAAKEQARIDKQELAWKTKLSKTYQATRIKQIHQLASLKGKLSRKEYAAELRRIKNLSDAERRRELQKANSYIKSGKGVDPRSDMLRPTHALKTTALYGAMAQILFGVQNAFANAGKAVIEFDQAVKDNMAVLQKSNGEATQLAQTVQGLGVRFGTQFDEIQEGMITLGRAGVEATDQLAKGTKGLAALSVITGDAMQYGASAMSSMLVVYPKLAKNMDGLANKMGAVANATRLGLEDFSTISNYALTTASNIGITADSYLALQGAMSKVGTNASSIGTSIARVGRFTLDQNKNTLKFFNGLGISQKKFAQALKADSKSALIVFAEKLGDAAKNSEKWRDMTAGLQIQMRKTANTIAKMGQLKSLEDMFNKIDNAKSVTEQADLAAKGLGRSWTSVKARLSEVAVELSSNVLKAIGDVVNDTKNGVGATEAFAQGFKSFGSVAIKVLGLVLSAVNGLVSTLALAFGNLQKLFGIAGQKIGEAAGGMSTEDYQKSANKIKKINKELAGLKAGDSRRTELRAERAEVKKLVMAYEENSSWAQRSVTDGEDMRRSGEKLRESTKKGAIEMQHIANVMMGIDTTFKKVKKSAKENGDEMKTSIDKSKKAADEAKKAMAGTNDINGGKGAKAAANKAQRDHNRLIKDAISLKNKEVELENAKIDLKTAEFGILLTEHQINDIATRDAALKVKYAEEAFAFAKQESALLKGKDGGDKARKKVVEAELKLVKAKTDYAKKHLKEELKVYAQMADGIKGSIKSAFAGDWKGVFENMTSPFEKAFDDAAEAIGKGMMNMFNGIFNASKSVGDAISGMMESLMANPYMAIIGAVIAALKGGLFNSGTEYSPEEYKKMMGASSSPESESATSLLESMDRTLVNQLKYTKGMYANLKIMAVQTGKAAVSLDSNFSYKNKDAYTPGALGGLWGGKDVKTLFTGLEVSFNAMKGALANNLEVIQTTKSSWFGFRKKTSQSTNRTPVEQQTLDAINSAYEAGIKAITNAASALGIKGADDMIAGFVGTLHKLDFEGKSQEEIQAMISGAISSDLDAMVKSFAPWITEFAKMGEGAMETLGRVAYEFEATNLVLEELGGTAQDASYSAIKLSQALVEASGGMDALLSNLQGYIDNFYTDAQKAELALNKMKSAGLNTNSRDDYIREVEYYRKQMEAGSESAAKMLAKLLELQDTANEYYSYLEKMESQQYDYLTTEFEFRKAIEASNKRIADQMYQMRVSVANYYRNEAAEKAKAQQDKWQRDRDFYADILKRIEDAYSGSLSYLNSLEKIQYFDRLAKNKLEQGDSKGYFDALGKQLEYEKKMSASKEDYVLKFDNYINELKSAEPEATMDDAVGKLDTLIAETINLQNAVRRSSYQKAF